MKTDASLLADLTIKLDHVAITRAIFRGRETTPEWTEKVGVVLQTIEPILQPGALCRWFAVEQVAGGQAALVDPKTNQRFVLQLGEHAEELAAAEMLVCSVVTLGEAFDHTVRQWTQTGEMLDGYLADCVGVYGLLQVSRAVYQVVEGVAQERGWGVGRVLCPGAIEGWALEEQHQLCALLPMAEIGVVLNECGVLAPAKSVSFVIGVGPGYATTEVDSPCDICTNSGECWCKC